MVQVYFRVRSVGLSVGLSVGNELVLWKNGYLDRDAVWMVGLGEPKEYRIDGGPNPPLDGARLRKWGGTM